MNGFVLLIPFLLIRFFLLSQLSQDGVLRAAHFPTMLGREVQAYWIYQISNVAIVVCLCFLYVIPFDSWMFIVGGVVYTIGLILCFITILCFVKPLKEGLNENGIYQFSRNPMYVSYFFIFVGCSFLTGSLILFTFVLIFQVTAHWIILAEERWCLETFGDEYRKYMGEVRRYF